jgi:hypothetical protein
MMRIAMHPLRIHGLAAVSTLAALLGFADPAAAADPYTVTVTVDGQTYTRSFGSTQEAQSLLNRRGLLSIAPNYTNRSSVNGTVDVRGLPVTFNTIPGTTALRISAPAAGFDRTFDAGSAAATQNLVESFLRGNEDRAGLEQLVQGIVATSTTDPVAGNPASLLGQSVINDYAIGTLVPGDDGGMSPRAAGWHFTGGFYAQHQDGRAADVTNYSLPLGVSYTFGVDGPEVFLHVPLTISDVRDGTAYQGTGSVGVRLPVITGPDLRWALTPAVRWGAAGSWDEGSVGQTYGGSVTSDLRVAVGGFVVGIGNSVAHYRTEPLEYGDYRISYDLKNWSFRNGISISKPVAEVAGQPLVVGASFIDTRMTGDDLAVDSWQEYGVSATFGSQVPVRVSASYLDGERGYNGFRIGVALAF